MKFKITNKAIEWLKIEYEDGSWAQIPAIAGLTKNAWHKLIKDYAPKNRVEKLEDIPWNIGDEEDTNTDTTEYPEYSYESARWFLYPTSEEETTALYASRQGDNTLLTAHDKKMTDVNNLVPVDESKTYTHAEVLELRGKLI